MKKCHVQFDMYFLFLFIVVIIIRLFAIKGRKKNSVGELNFYIAALFVFIAFRDVAVGNDTGTYCRWYLKTLNYTLTELLEKYSHLMESGYLVFTKVLAMLLPFSRVLILVQGLIVSLSLRAFILRFCKNDTFLPIIIFLAFGLLSFHLTGIRQSLSMSFCLFSYVSASNHRHLAAAFWFSIALSFHTAAIIFILAYLFTYVWKKYNNLIVTTSLLCVVVASSAPFIQLYLSQSRDKWNVYEEIERTDNGVVFFVVVLLITIFVEFHKKKHMKENAALIRTNYLNLILWSGRLVSRAFERPALYFTPYIMTVLPSAVHSITSPKLRSLAYFSFVFLVSILYIYRYHNSYYSFCF